MPENGRHGLDPDLLPQPVRAVEQRTDVVQFMPCRVPLHGLGLAGGLEVSAHRCLVEVSLELGELEEQGIPYKEYTQLEKALPETDVLYVTRVQKERFEDPQEYEKVKGTYIISSDTLKKAKEDLVLMHPLPRVGEISMDLDDDPRAAYFRQMEYGMYVRMALLAMVLGKA